MGNLKENGLTKKAQGKKDYAENISNPNSMANLKKLVDAMNLRIEDLESEVERLKAK